MVVIEWNHEIMDKKADGCLVVIKTLYQRKNLSFYLPATFLLRDKRNSLDFFLGLNHDSNAIIVIR